MGSRWRYSVRVPDYAKEEKQGEEIVVYYQVDVLVQAPGAGEPSTPSTVYRRFSEFRQLHTNLKQAFPDLFKSKSLEPPPKRSLRFVNNSERLLSERRQKLEQWLWRLLGHPELAQSRDMKLFLQLNLAIRAANSGIMSPRSSVAGGLGEFGTPREGSEPDTDAVSEVSAPSGITNFSHAPTDLVSLGMSQMPSASPHGDATEVLRMGLKVEERSDLKKLLEKLTFHLEKAGKDLQDSTAESLQLQQINKELQDKVQKLEKRLDSQDDGQDAALDEMEEKLKAKDARLTEAQSKVHNLQEIVSKLDDRCATLQAEVQKFETESRVTEDRLVSVETEWKLKLEEAEKSKADLQGQLATGKAKFKQDAKLLAKEIAKLRDGKEAMDRELSILKSERSDQGKVEAILQNAEQEKETLGKEIEELKAVVEANAGELRSCKEAADQDSNRRSALEVALQNAEGECEDLKMDNDRINGLNAELQSSVAKSTGRVQQLETEVAGLKDAIQKGKSEIENRVARCEEAERKLGLVQNDASGSTQVVRELEERLVLACSERDALRERVDDHSRAGEELASALGKLKLIEEECEGLRRDRNSHSGMGDRAASLQDQVTKLELENKQLRADNAHQESTIKGLTEENASMTGLVHESERKDQELGGLGDLVKKLQAENLSLKKERDVLLSPGSDSQVLIRKVDALTEEKSELKQKVQDLEGAKGEADQLRMELEKWALGNGNVDSSDEVENLKAECERLNVELGKMSLLNEDLQGLTQENLQLVNERDHLQGLLGEQQEVPVEGSDLMVGLLAEARSAAEELRLENEELRGRVNTLESSVGKPDMSSGGPLINLGEGGDVTLASSESKIEELEHELERLNSENASLREAVGDIANGTASTTLPVVVDVVRDIYTELQACSAGMTSGLGDGPVDPNEAAEFMEKMANSNGHLQLVSARTQELRRGAEASTDTHISELSRALADVLSDLAGKYRQINEMRVDQFLTKTVDAAPPKSPPRSLPIAIDQIQTRGAPQSTRTSARRSPSGRTSPDSGKRSMFSRLVGSPTEASVRQRDPGSDAEGGSKVRGFLDGMGSKFSQGSQGFLHFMQRGQPQPVPQQPGVNRAVLGEPLLDSGSQTSNGNEPVAHPLAGQPSGDQQQG